MSFQIVSVSPKGKLQYLYQNGQIVNLKIRTKSNGGTIILRPIEIKFADDDLKDFAKLAESFSFWDNEDDDIYENFTRNRNEDRGRYYFSVIPLHKFTQVKAKTCSSYFNKVDNGEDVIIWNNK